MERRCDTRGEDSSRAARAETYPGTARGSGFYVVIAAMEKSDVGKETRDAYSDDAWGKLLPSDLYFTGGRYRGLRQDPKAHTKRFNM